MIDVPIRYIFILKQLESDNLYNIGILTDSYQYHSIEYKTINDQVITAHSLANMRKIFFNLKITQDTEIVLNDVVKETSNIYMFLSMMRHFIPFKFTRTTYITVLKRILNYHKSFLRTDNLKEIDYKKIYDKLLEHQNCTWISTLTEQEIANLSNRSRRSQKQLRVAMYYMCIRRYLSNKNKK